MAVKIPLKMKDDVPVRSMEELKQHFDPEKLLVYFRDGKLQTWLESRYYEEELEAVNALGKDDPELPKKLCAVFGEEYSGGAEIDVEAIQRRNARIAKLKQYTSDEEVIANIDSVAFDQEELVELYDKGVTEIYLCAGSFTIPKSKSHLRYHYMGLNATVNGLPQSKTAESNITEEKNTSINRSRSAELQHSTPDEVPGQRLGLLELQRITFEDILNIIGSESNEACRSDDESDQLLKELIELEEEERRLSQGW